MIMGQIFIMIIMIILMIMIILGKFIGSKWLSWLLGLSWSSRKCSLDMSWPSSWPYAQETSWPFWTDHQGIIYLHFISVSFHFSILDLQLENQLFQGNQAALGSPLWRFITCVKDILHFMQVSWISSWRTNCFRGTKDLLSGDSFL